MTKWKNPRIGPAFYMSFRSVAEGFAFQEKYPASYPLQTCQAPKPQIPSPIKAIATPISCPQLAILVIERKKKPRRLSRGFLVFAAKQKHLNHLDVILCSAVTSESNTLRGRSRPKSNDSKTLGLRVGRGQWKFIASQPAEPLDQAQGSARVHSPEARQETRAAAPPYAVRPICVPRPRRDAAPGPRVEPETLHPLG